MKRVLTALQKVENLMIVISFSVMVLAAFAQVVNRNIFRLGIGWFEELSVYCMIWMTLLGTELGLRDGTQASVTAFVDRLRGTARRLVQLIAKTLVVIFSATITHSAYGMVLKQLQTGQTTPGLKIPMAIPYAALLVGFGIMTIVQGATVLLSIARFGKDDPDGGAKA